MHTLDELQLTEIPKVGDELYVVVRIRTLSMDGGVTDPGALGVRKRVVTNVGRRWFTTLDHENTNRAFCIRTHVDRRHEHTGSTMRFFKDLESAHAHAGHVLNVRILSQYVASYARVATGAAKLARLAPADVVKLIQIFANAEDA